MTAPWLARGGRFTSILSAKRASSELGGDEAQSRVMEERRAKSNGSVSSRAIQGRTSRWGGFWDGGGEKELNQQSQNANQGHLVVAQVEAGEISGR
jgi:hypothetical protein